MKRFLSLLISMVMVFACVSQTLTTALAATVQLVTGAPEDYAMHFMIRQWHTMSDPAGPAADEDTGSDDAYSASSLSAHSVLITGTITPTVSNGVVGAPFDIAWTVTDNSGKTLNKQDTYINSGAVDTAKGSLVISANPYTDTMLNGTVMEVETFAGFSISAGHSAMEIIGDGTQMRITYDVEVPLVKGHVFYTSAALQVKGGKLDAISGGDAEIDTAYWNAATGEYQLNRGAGLTKVYDSSRGLHTDKTATLVPDSDGRTFNVDLEAWFADGNPPLVAMILDASGSMAFAADTPEKITLTAEQIKQLGIKQVTSAATQDEGFDFRDYFLTDEQINQILNTHKTENSALGASGYSYYVYHSLSDVREYTPISYWAGYQNTVTGSIPQADKLIGYYAFERGNYTDDTRDWLLNSITGQYAAMVEQVPMASADGSFTFEPDDHTVYGWGIDGFDMRDNSKTYDRGFRFTTEKATKGVLLDAKPTSGDFTISFAITRDSTDTSYAGLDNVKQEDVEAGRAVGLERADVLYIGDMTVSSAKNYLRVRRLGRYGSEDTGGSQNRLRGFNFMSDGTSTQPVNMNNIFGGSGVNATTERRYITLVFKGGEVWSYVDGTFDSNSAVTLDDNHIILNAFEDQYNGQSLLLDDVYVFDAPLSDEQVRQLYDFTKKSTTKDNRIFTNTSVPDIFVAKTENDRVIGMLNKLYPWLDELTGAIRTDAGWYYINPTSNWETNYINEDLQSGKILHGVLAPTAGTDYAYQDVVYLGVDENGSDVVASGTHTKATYQPANQSAIQFYVDTEGNLRCFFAKKVDEEDFKYGCSFVYQAEDSGYTKVEALQRALGAFIVKLSDVAPGSEVSAVRFSTEQVSVEYSGNSAAEAENLKKLVLLDWAANPAKSVGILSLQRGPGSGPSEYKGGTLGYDESENGIKQYNYGLTGGTATFTGLRAFKENLLYGAATDPSRDKYVIIFTDGLDKTSEVGNSMNIAEELAKEMKAAGFTIFTVMLSGGTVAEGTEEFKRADEFLRKLAGTPTGEAREGAKFAYSTAVDGKEAHVDPNNASAIVDNLTNIFTGNIINQITNILDGYSIEDYIDPRFDLIDANGDLWQLNADGMVATPKWSKTLGADGEEIWVSRAGDVSEEAQKAHLFYDEKEELYFLRWTNQIIPGCQEGAENLAIWNTRITIRAKEDFIGGNAVLTNGPSVLMNYVYHPDDKTNLQDSEDWIAPSSGTNDTMRHRDIAGIEVTNYPSKGFPRVVVNVEMPVPTSVTSELYYLGESLDLEQALRQMIRDAIDTNGTGRWYWQYLERYEAIDDEVISKLLDSADQSVTIPYQYLPSLLDDYPNHTGTEKHEADKLGEITYRWSISPADGYAPTESKATRTVTLSVDYKLYAEAEGAAKQGELTNENREALLNNNGLIDEVVNGGVVYKWNKAFKPSEGSASGKNGAYTYSANLVSGDVKLQMLLPKATIEYLQRLIPGQTVTYQATLTRTYEEGGIVDDPVATYAISYQVPEEAPTGDVIVTVAAEDVKFESKYAYAAENGLPIGTYTMTPAAEANASTLYSFSAITRVELQSTAEHADLFALYPEQIGEKVNGQQQPLTGFAALYDGESVQPMLGTDGSAAKAYTDERYALLRVTMVFGSGSLTVSKTVAGNGGETDKAFTFTVTLSDASVNGLLGDMRFENGVATFTLKHGESKTAIGLPSGVDYTVTESDNDGYDTTSTGESGTITEDTAAVAAFTNTRSVGGLTVSKTVAGNGGETDKAFTFTVTLSDTSVNGTYGGMSFQNGVATFTLKHGESKTASGLPIGVGYTVAESGNDGYVTTSTGESGTITEDVAAVAAFVNTRNVGGLTVTKTVAGNGGETDKEFAFTVTLSDVSINGAYGRMNFQNGVASFKLKHGDSITAQFLPIGVTYTVKEEAASGYATTSTGATGTINANSMAIAAFVNTRNAGSLTVSKTVKGTAGETDKAFSFTVMLSDTGLSGTYGDMIFKDGVASFKLKHGESKTAAGLPAGVRYSVIELEANQNGYTTTTMGERGDIENAANSAAIFINVKDAEPEVPQTGDNSRLGLWIALMLASILGLCASFAAYRKKGSKMR